jgi:DNA-binding GntR family transcriptional regulator
VPETETTYRLNTAVDLAERWIRDAILTGKLGPDERINQDAIAAELQVSRMPVREALAKLEKAGFVNIQPHRGSRVAPLSIDHIEEVYLMRASLESLAARLASGRMTDDKIRRLKEILNQVAVAIKERDAERLFELNRDFHRIGYEASGKPFLCTTINNLRDHCDRYRRHQTRIAERAPESLKEHQDILRAWEKRDPAGAEEATRLNLENSAASLIKVLRDEEGRQA